MNARLDAAAVVAHHLSWGLVDGQTAPVKRRDSGAWPALAALVTQHQVSAAKEGPGWVPADIAPGRRLKERAHAWCVLVLDVEAAAEKRDGAPPRVIGPLPPTVQEMVGELELRGWAACIATSHSHEGPAEDGTLGPRYRVVLLPSRAIAVAEVQPLALQVAALLGVADCIDKTCFNADRLFFLPRCPAARRHLAERAIVDGDPLPVDALLQQAEAAAAVVKRRAGGETASVIDAFNAQADVAQLLERHGYKAVGRNRWTCPASTTGMPGVVLLPESGRVYSHHGASDPLSGKSHDAFSVWCVLEHGDNASQAVRAAARLLGMDRSQRPALEFQTAVARLPVPSITTEDSPNEPQEPATWVDAVRDWQPPADLDALDVPVRFAVDGWIQAGKVGALVAAGSTGKTTLLLILGICIALGRDFFGAAVMQGTFVLLSPDDSQQDLGVALARVAKALQLSGAEKAEVSQRVRVVSLQGLAGVKTFTASDHGSVIDTGLAELIMQAVAGIPDLVGIALDTLRQFSGGNSNDEQVIKLTITGATEVAQRSGAFVILPHHTGKQNYRDGVADMYAGSGSAAIADNCRFVLLLQTTTWADIEAKVRRTGQEQGDPLVLTSTRGSLLVRAPEPMFLHRDGYCIERVAGAVLTYDQQADDKARAVLRAVRDGRQTKTEIAAAVRGRKTDILARVDDLIGRGFLLHGNQSGTGKLMVTARGAAFLDAA